jgi:hypothetical protein
MNGDNPAVIETRNALVSAIGSGSQSAWANANGVDKNAVNDVWRRVSIGVDRLNAVRFALDLPLIKERDIKINDSQQVIAAPGYGRKRSPRFEFRCTEEEAKKIRAYMDYHGVQSFTELVRKIFHLDPYRPTDWGEYND